MFAKRLKICALLGVSGGLTLTACGEKNDENAAAAAGNVEPVAAATGFAKHLPQSTHAYAAVFDGKGFLDDLRGSKLVKLLEKQAADAGAFRWEDLEQNPEAQMVLSLFAEEFFVAAGAGSAEQAGHFIALNESSTRAMMQGMVQMLEAQFSGEEPENPGAFAGPFGGAEMMMFGGLFRDPGAGLPILEKAALPPVMLGFKVSDKDMRDQLLGIASNGLAQALQQMGPDGEDVAEPIKVQRGESEFTGLKIIGTKVAAKMNDEVREQMSTMMDAETVDELIKIIETKTIVVAVGTYGDYLIGFAGTDIEDLKMAASPSESVLARPDLAFMDGYADKKLLMVASMSQEMQESMAAHSTLLGSMAIGIKNGLAEAKSFGDTQDLETLLGLVAEQEKALFGMYSYAPSGLVVFREEGLKAEAYGGSDMADLNLEAPRKYASIGMQEDIFLFANSVENPAFTEKALEYFDSIGQAVYLGAKGVSKLDIEDGDLAEFKEGFGMFDERLRPHLVELWTALRSDLVSGLGNEGAIIVDLNGGLPTVPGLPQVVIDEGKAPRIAMVAPAVEKERLAQSWKRIDKSVSELLKVASEMSGENIPMQRPMSSEKNDLKTWFFALPFQTDDFVLSVSVDKEHFFASTSKSFVQDLSAKLETAEVDETQTGAYFNVNFVLLNEYLQQWVKLLEENAADIFGEDSPASEDFREALPTIKEAIEAAKELKGITGHIRKEDGTVRTSLHIATGA